MIWLAAFAAGVVSIPASWSARERAAAAAITADTIRAPLAWLADDRCEGRRPGTAGSRRAIEFLVGELARAGLSPAGDGGGYLQAVPLVEARRVVTAGPVVVGPHGKLALALGSDALVGGGAQTEHAIVEAELVFAGYGGAGELADARGRAAIVLDGEPRFAVAARGRSEEGRVAHKLEEAARAGVRAVLLVHDPESGLDWERMRTRLGESQLERPAAGESRVEWLLLHRDAAARLVSFAGRDLEQLRREAEAPGFRALPLGARLAVELRTRLTPATSANVLASLPGRERPGEWVVYTAHHDGFGQEGDRIFHGAIDNAGGVASLLAIARAMAQARLAPRRSILFAFTTAEEFGLAGSQFLVEHPPGRLVAGVNLDGIQVGGATRDVVAVGFGRSPLDGLVRATAAEQGREVHGEPAPERGRALRADSYSLARAGVPVVYLNAGVDLVGRPPGSGAAEIARFRRERYHRPEDTFDPKWELTGAIDNARLELVLGARLADVATLPAAGAPGD